MRVSMKTEKRIVNDRSSIRSDLGSEQIHDLPAAGEQSARDVVRVRRRCVLPDELGNTE